MTRRRYTHTCTNPDECPYCHWLEDQAEEVAFDTEHEPADPQRELDAADREAQMDRRQDRWS